MIIKISVLVHMIFIELSFRLYDLKVVYFFLMIETNNQIKIKMDKGMVYSNLKQK